MAIDILFDAYFCIGLQVYSTQKIPLMRKDMQLARKFGNSGVPLFTPTANLTLFVTDVR